MSIWTTSSMLKKMAAKLKFGSFKTKISDVNTLKFPKKINSDQGRKIDEVQL